MYLSKYKTSLLQTLPTKKQNPAVIILNQKLFTT